MSITDSIFLLAMVAIPINLAHFPFTHSHILCIVKFGSDFQRRTLDPHVKQVWLWQAFQTKELELAIPWGSCSFSTSTQHLYGVHDSDNMGWCAYAKSHLEYWFCTSYAIWYSFVGRQWSSYEKSRYTPKCILCSVWLHPPMHASLYFYVQHMHAMPCHATIDAIQWKLQKWTPCIMETSKVRTNGHNPESFPIVYCT